MTIAIKETKQNSLSHSLEQFDKHMLIKPLRVICKIESHKLTCLWVKILLSQPQTPLYSYSKLCFHSIFFRTIQKFSYLIKTHYDILKCYNYNLSSYLYIKTRYDINSIQNFTNKIKM